MKNFIAGKAVRVCVTAVLVALSPGTQCWAAAVAAAKAAVGGGGAPMAMPAIVPGLSPAVFQPGAFSAGGLSFSPSLPAPAAPIALPAPKPLPWSSAPDEVSRVPAVFPAPALTQPDLEALQVREVGQELPLLAPEAPAADPLTEKNIMAVLRLLSQKQRSGYELLGQTGLAPDGLRRAIERLDAMGMLFIHGSLQPRDIGSAQISLKPSASGAALLISQPWPGTDALSSRALDGLALLQTKARFGYELMSALEMDRPKLENLITELLNTGLIHLSGDFRGPGVDNTLVSIPPSNIGKVKAVQERKRLLKLLLPAPEAHTHEAAATRQVKEEVLGIGQDISPRLEAAHEADLGAEATSQAGEIMFLRLQGRRFKPAPAAELETLPDPTLKKLNPKIAVTPVSEHLPGVFFVKFLRDTTLKTMLGILAGNGVNPELYADNGDGFRVRVALPEVSAARAAARLAAEGQVESVEVSLRVYDILRRGTLRKGVYIHRASGPADTAYAGLRPRLDKDMSSRKPDAGRSDISRISRHLSMKEFHVLNGVGVVVSLLAGVLLAVPLLGLLGTLVATIPVTLAYVGIKRLLGDKVDVPQMRFSPGISWGGKRHQLLDKKATAAPTNTQSASGRLGRADYAFAGAGAFAAVGAFALAGVTYALGVAAGAVAVMAAGAALWLDSGYRAHQKERDGHAPGGRERAFRIVGSFLAGAGFTGMAVGLGAQILLAPFREAATVVLASLGGFAGLELGLKAESSDNGIFDRAGDELKPVLGATLAGIAAGVVASRVLFYLLGVHAPATLLDGLREILSGAHGSLLGLLSLGIGGIFSRGALYPAGASLPKDGRGAARLHDAYKDWGEGLGGLAGTLLALGVGAWAFAAASASLALPVALFWGAVAALAVGMLTTLALASLGRDIGDRLGRGKVDRIHLDFLDLHHGRIEAVPGVASVRYQISIPGLSDAVTPADGPLFVVVLDGTVPFETVRRELAAAVPELAGFPVFFERGGDDR